MTAFIIVAVILSAINLGSSLFLYFRNINAREYKELLRRYNSYKEELSIMTTVLHSFLERCKSSEENYKTKKYI